MSINTHVIFFTSFFWIHGLLFGLEPPEFVRKSAAPKGFRLEINGFEALIIPEIEQSLSTTSLSQFANAISNTFRDMPPTELITHIDDAIFRTRGHWGRFNLRIDGNKKRYQLFNLEGGLIRDVSFDGNAEIQYFVDSGQASVFDGRSHVAIPSIEKFYPYTAELLLEGDWKSDAETASVRLKNLEASARCGTSGFVEQFSIGQNRIVVTRGWRSLSGIAMPAVVADLRGDSACIKSIDLMVIERWGAIEGLSIDELKIGAPAGTTVVDGGLGSPSMGTRKLREDTRDLAAGFRDNPSSSGSVHFRIFVGLAICLLGIAVIYFRKNFSRGVER